MVRKDPKTISIILVPTKIVFIHTFLGNMITWLRCTIWDSMPAPKA